MFSFFINRIIMTSFKVEEIEFMSDARASLLARGLEVHNLPNKRIRCRIANILMMLTDCMLSDS